MANLKHTVVAMIAVAMIGTLAAAQASEFSADGQKTQGKSAQIEIVDTVSNEIEDTYFDESEPAAEEAEPASEEEKVMPASAPAEEGGVYVLVKEGALNIRSEANTDSEVIGKHFCSDKLAIIAEEGDWYKIAFGTEGKTGYVSKASTTTSFEEAKALALETTMYEQGTAEVSEGALNVRSGASKDSEVVDQLDNGDKVVILAKEGDWLKVYYGRDYNVGYVIADSVNIDGMVLREAVAIKKGDRIAAKAQSKGVITISSGAVNVRSAAKDDADVITQLSNKDNVLIMSSSNGWTKIAFGTAKTIGYVKSEYVVNPDAPKPKAVTNPSRTATAATRSKANPTKSTASSSSKKVVDSAPATGSTKGQALVNEAAKYLGTKYVYGGSSPSGFDCSGLVQYVCRKQGISVGRSSRDQFNNGVAVSKDNLQPGDLVFFKRGGTISHVGIYAGNGQMIHSPQTGKTVCYTSINSASRQKSYAGARRVAN